MRISSGLALGAGLLVSQSCAAEPKDLKTPKEKTSYALGMDLGNSLRKRAIDLDSGVFSQGLRDGLSGGKTLLTEAEAAALIRDLQTEQKNKQTAREKKTGEDFLVANKTKEGVVALASGLQYRILRAGNGKKPTVDDTVVCHYRGALIDGTEFDSSYKRNQPVTVPVKGVAKGWAEALQLMPAGSQWQLFLPPQLVRSESGAGSQSLGDNTVIFELELISIRERKP